MDVELQKYKTKIHVTQAEQSNEQTSNATTEPVAPSSNGVPAPAVTSGYDNVGFIHDDDDHKDIKLQNEYDKPGIPNEHSLENFEKNRAIPKCTDSSIEIGDRISYIDVKTGLVVTENGVPADGKFYVVRATSDNHITPELANEKDNDEDEDDDDDGGDENCCSRIILRIQLAVGAFFRTHKRKFYLLFLLLLLIGYFVYFGFALNHRFGDDGSIRLVVCTAFGGLLIILNLLSIAFKDQLERIAKYISQVLETKTGKFILKLIKWGLYVGMFVFMVAYLVSEIFIDHPRNTISLAGSATFIVILYITSSNPAKVNWHPVFWGMTLQFIFALMILRTDWGRDTFQYLGDRVTEFLNYTKAGAGFVFGLEGLAANDISIFAFNVLPIVVFVGSMTAVMYYLGAIQGVIKYIGRFLSFCLGTSAAESLNASANIFLGMTEAPLIIKNYIADMTKSELNAIMTGGFATIAGSVLGAYITMGIDPKHLLSASVMSAPAALAMAKLTCPETNPKKAAANQNFDKMEKSADRNVIEAAANGAMFTIKLVANIAVNLIAFISILAFMNATLTWFGDRIGVDNLTFELITSYVLYPVAFLMGADTNDCRKLAELIGVKTFTNEFVAYGRLGIIMHTNNPIFAEYIRQYNSSDAWEWRGSDVFLKYHPKITTLQYGVLFHERSILIATYALCGFANFGSMGITLGGMSAIAPKRKTLLAKIVLRAMIAGNIACFLTACIAGMLYEG